MQTYQNELILIQKPVLINIAKVPYFGENVNWKIGKDHVRFNLASRQLSINGVEFVIDTFIFFDILSRNRPIE